MEPEELRLRAACLERRGYKSDKAELCDNENAALLRDFAALLDLHAGSVFMRATRNGVLRTCVGAFEPGQEVEIIPLQPNGQAQPAPAHRAGDRLQRDVRPQPPQRRGLTMKSGTLLTIDVVTDDATGIYRVGDLDHGLTAFLSKWLQRDGNREKLALYLETLGADCRFARGPFHDMGPNKNSTER